MSEEKYKCECGCEYEGTYKETFDVVFKALEEQKNQINLIGLTCSKIIKDIMELRKQGDPTNNSPAIIIDSLCDDIKVINDRLDRLEGKNNPQVMVCYDKDVKPV